MGKGINALRWAFSKNKDWSRRDGNPALFRRQQADELAQTRDYNRTHIGEVMKLTNDELLKMSDSNVAQSVKDFICEQKMDKQEIAVCRALGQNLSDYMITKTIG